MILPKEDKYYGTKETMREQIIHLLGGRVAEMLTLDDISTGASNDIQRATDIAREMVTKYGFSDRLGPVNYSASEEVFLGNDFSSKKNYSEETAAEIDEEVKAIVEEAFEAAKKILTDHMQQLTNVAEGLLEVETLDNAQFVQLFDGDKTPEQLAEDLQAEMEARKEKDKAEAAESAKIRKREAELEKKRIEEAAKLLESQGKRGKFKPTIMTYNDLTKKAEPLDLGKLATDDEDDEKPPQTEGDDQIIEEDDDMPSEEELAVYDTDYLNADDDEGSEAEETSEEAADDDSSVDGEEKRNE